MPPIPARVYMRIVWDWALKIAPLGGSLTNLTGEIIIGTEFQYGGHMSRQSQWQLRECEQIIPCNAGLLNRRHFLIAITRVRNEALILRDTLQYIGQHVDAIVAYDDASTDRTLE